MLEILRKKLFGFLVYREERNGRYFLSKMEQKSQTQRRGGLEIEKYSSFWISSIS
jgi:hypothetical protein